MEYQKLYQDQIRENQDLKSQVDILETILRSFLPVVEKKENNQMNKISIFKLEDFDIFEGPSDDELESIEDEFSDF